MNIYTHLHLIFICRDEINIDDEISENVGTNIYGDIKDDHVIRYRVKLIVERFFKDESVTVQAQILRGILTSKKIKSSYNSIWYLKLKKR